MYEKNNNKLININNKNMPFNIDDAINNTQNYFVSFPLLYRIAKNPIYLSLIITLIICLIMYMAFQDIDLKKVTKLGILVFIISLSLIFIQNTILLKVEKKKSLSIYGQGDNYSNNIETYEAINENDPRYQEVVPNLGERINLNNLYGGSPDFRSHGISQNNGGSSGYYGGSTDYRDHFRNNVRQKSTTYDGEDIDLLSNLKSNTVMNMDI